MRTVAMLSQKGGTGKTTLSLHLAVAAEIAQHSAVIIDLDPQASAAEWKDSRQQDTPIIVPVPAPRLPQVLQAAQEGGADLVLIDTAPHAGDVALAAAADLGLIPCRAGILDLRAIGTTARTVKLAGKKAYVVLNAVPPHASHALDDARAAVAVHGLEVAPVALRQRAAYSHALTAGQTGRNTSRTGRPPRTWRRFTNGFTGHCRRLPDCSFALLLAKIHKGNKAYRQHINTAKRQHGKEGRTYGQATESRGENAPGGHAGHATRRTHGGDTCAPGGGATTGAAPRRGHVRLLCFHARREKEGDGSP